MDSEFCKVKINRGFSPKGLFKNHLQKLRRLVKLPELPLVEDHDLVVVHDGVEAMCDGEDAALCKLLPDGGLDQVVCLQVYGCCCLVKNQNLNISLVFIELWWKILFLANSMMC